MSMKSRFLDWLLKGDVRHTTDEERWVPLIPVSIGVRNLIRCLESFVHFHSSDLYEQRVTTI